MDALVLHNRHTGERLELQRIARDGETWLSLSGTLPPHSQGPPLHVHYQELEEGQIISGTLSAIVNGKQIQVGVGQAACFPPGSVHRWWNGGHETLVFKGWCKPVVDLDRYLQAVFDVINSGSPDRPPLFYIAHVAWRHRRTQAVLLMPRPFQSVMLPLMVLIGTILGRYQGTNWPGAPARCTGAPLIAREAV
jgi:mannose-6-phosphate isomerase-like protein (cupin superfamily)